SRAGGETSVTLAAATPAASFGQPVGAGAGAAGAAATRTVGALTSLPEPLEFDAATSTRMVLPMSSLPTLYVGAVAPLMSRHASPFAPQIRHWYWNVIGCAPLQLPASAVIVLPAETSPLIVGGDVLRGASAACAMRSVGRLVAPLEPSPLLAIPCTRSVLPTSAFRIAYVWLVAPPMSLHAPPFAPQIRHWYWNVIGAEPRHVPGFAVTVLPADA